MALQPYLFFDGRCEEALDFYRSAVGAEVQMLMRIKDAPEPPQPGTCPPAAGEKILHAAFKVGDALILASDGECKGKPSFHGFSLALSFTDAGAVERAFNGLAAGGRVNMPLAKTYFSERFGMLVDRFGVQWMLMLTAAQPAGDRP
jgi:PhnB protein